MIQLEETEPTFKIVPGGSSRGKDVLVSSDGFSYVHKRTLKSGAVVWRCVKRSKKTTCQVTVKQISDKFAMQENRKHLHDPETDANTVRLVKKEIRDKALGQAGLGLSTVLGRTKLDTANKKARRKSSTSDFISIRTTAIRLLKGGIQGSWLLVPYPGQCYALTKASRRFQRSDTKFPVCHTYDLFHVYTHNLCGVN
ncbi:hypothetical protein CAPTEDRAFT_222085 [Capitella teleta]|uniref:Uncharacterized protein n=1 Tax=Capitella teleta TaxID=283909 RepID=R7TV30_CAPTE|nr:hypothetical protein CAPTEDRAFT_222085 [Capitella teleta]|eukprot:ELT95301.1 hypothetical protein CAPTEDRAFT_222085 [Capitella teleta]